MPNLRGSELLILVLLVVILFGARRLPDAARSMGRSLRIFKAETKGLVEGETEPSEPANTSATTTTATPKEATAEITAGPPTTEAPSPVVSEQTAPEAQPQPPRQG